MNIDPINVAKKLEEIGKRVYDKDWTPDLEDNMKLFTFEEQVRQNQEKLDLMLDILDKLHDDIIEIKDKITTTRGKK